MNEEMAERYNAIEPKAEAALKAVGFDPMIIITLLPVLLELLKNCPFLPKGDAFNQPFALMRTRQALRREFGGKYGAMEIFHMARKVNAAAAKASDEDVAELHAVACECY
jgi:hypothetical protein